MKKLMAVFFASALILSTAFVGSSIPGDASFAAYGQQRVTVRKKRKPGIVRGTYRGGKWVVRKSWDGTKWVSKRVWSGTKWVGKKSWKNGRKVVSRTKKIVY